MAAIMGSDVDFGDNVYIEGLGYMPTEMYAQHLRMQGLEPNEAQSEYLTVQEYLGKGEFRNATEEMPENPVLDDAQLALAGGPSRMEGYKATLKDPEKNLIPGIKDEYLIVGTIIAVIFLV